MEHSEERFADIMLQKYPSIFPTDNDGNPRLPSSGFGVSKGWEPLIDSLCNYLVVYTNIAPSAKVRIEQVKSKFGSLRFYYTGGDELVRGVVAMAQFLSWGQLMVNDRGYWRTLSSEEGASQGFKEPTTRTTTFNGGEKQLSYP